MKIYLITEALEEIIGYESDIAPRIGEEIILPCCGEKYVVERVLHRIRNRATGECPILHAFDVTVRLL